MKNLRQVQIGLPPITVTIGENEAGETKIVDEEISISLKTSSLQRKLDMDLLEQEVKYPFGHQVEICGGSIGPEGETVCVYHTVTEDSWNLRVFRKDGKISFEKV